MISSDVIRGYNDTIILAILSKEPSYAYEISKTIKELTEGKYIIKETTLYSAFARLEKNNFIKPIIKTDQNESRRTYYQITDEGLSYLNEKKDEWATTQDVINKFI